MTSVAHQAAETSPAEARRGLLGASELWGTIAIVAMWMAVLFTAIYGGDFVSANGAGSQTTTVPSSVFVAFFACLGSVAVARRAFGRHTGSADRNRS